MRYQDSFFDHAVMREKLCARPRLLAWVFSLACLLACGDDTSSGGSGGIGGNGGSGGQGGAGAAGAAGGGDAGAQPLGGGPEGGAGGAAQGGGGAGEGGASAFELTSTAYGEGEEIPLVHVCSNGGGDNVSPPLAWTGAPAGAQSFAVVMRDLDFNNGFLHWVMWDIPAEAASLPEGIEQVFQPPSVEGAKQAPFNPQLTGYFGPCSPNSVNTYEITIYAIDVASLPNLDASTSKGDAAQAIEDAAIASASLSGES